MGYTMTHRPKGVGTVEFLRQCAEFDTETECRRMLAGAATLTEAYLAVEWLDKASGDRRVYALVFILSHTRDGYYNFGWKGMSEDEGPRPCNCPPRILTLLTPTDKEWALQWRKRCRESIRRREAFNRLRPGNVLVFDEPLRWRVCDSAIEDTVVIYREMLTPFRGRPYRVFRALSDDFTDLRIRPKTVDQLKFQVYGDLEAYRAAQIEDAGRAPLQTAA
jgi:hypothetical protein